MEEKARTERNADDAKRDVTTILTMARTMMMMMMMMMMKKPVTWQSTY